MDEHALTRALGWVSVGVGLASLAAPVPVMNAFGIGERPKIGRFLGARDIVLGAGLLRGEDKAAWARARGVSDALDAALILGGAATGAFRRDRAPVGLAMAAGLSVLSFRLARRLDER
jgi:hypothetical protein